MRLLLFSDPPVFHESKAIMKILASDFSISEENNFLFSHSFSLIRAELVVLLKDGVVFFKNDLDIPYANDATEQVRGKKSVLLSEQTCEIFSQTILKIQHLIKVSY
jgi:hypothetical protein